jgi:hypothetical protein
MLHELRTYTFHPGALPAYLKAAETIGRPARGNNYGTVHGYWLTEFGALNQVWHLWTYDSYEERTRLRAELQKNERWTQEYIPAIRPLIARQDIRFLNAAKPITPPKTEGGIYELRIYRTAMGQAKPWAQHYLNVMEVRERFGHNVGLWTGEAPQPNEGLHMWAYPNVETRIAWRKALFEQPEWKQFLSNTNGMVLDMQSMLLLPTAYSAMK